MQLARSWRIRLYPCPLPELSECTTSGKTYSSQRSLAQAADDFGFSIRDDLTRWAVSPPLIVHAFQVNPGSLPRR